MARPSDAGTRVRPARPGDVGVILTLIHDLAVYEREPDGVETTAAQLGAALFCPDPKAFCHVTEHDGEIVGFALWFVTFSTWLGRHGIWLEDLFVRPEHRGRGHGTALLRTLARICVERGYGRLEWSVLDWNEPALGFYRSIGAEPMDAWTTQRLAGEALARVATP